MNDHFKVKLVETGASSDHAAWRNSTKLWRFNKAPEKHLYIQNGPGNVPNPQSSLSSASMRKGMAQAISSSAALLGVEVATCLLKSENDFFGPAGRLEIPLWVLFSVAFLCIRVRVMTKQRPWPRFA